MNKMTAYKLLEDERGGPLGDEHGMGPCVHYRVDPPVQYDDYDFEIMGTVEKETRFVWVSQANAFLQGWETHIFPADNKGRVIDWGELPGSRKGYVHPDTLMEEIGYTIKED